MTVAELIEKLQKMPQKSEVIIIENSAEECSIGEIFDEPVHGKVSILSY